MAETQAPSSPTTEAGRNLIELIDAAGWIETGPGMAKAIRAIEQQARDEGRREAVRYESELPECGCKCHGVSWLICWHCRPDLLGDASESGQPPEPSDA